MIGSKYFQLIGLLALSFSLSTQVQAEQNACPAKLFNTIGRALKIENLQGDNQVIVAQACKPWPYDKNSLLTAFAFNEGVEGEKTYIVAIVDAKTLQPRASYKSTILEDAATEATEGSLKLDTAKYQISPVVRAFGVRFSSGARGASCADGSYWDELTLFTRQEEKLVPIFKQNMQSQEASSGCIGSATGHDAWEYTKKTISIAPSSTNGLADLQITATSIIEGDEEAIPKNANRKARVERHLLKFNGKAYAP